MSADVAIVIPTLRRPESLERAIRSALAQTGIEARLREIIVADNDPQGSARTTVECLSANASIPVRWCHAPRPGVATARNRGLAETDAPLIAFLDDDEEASPGWLSALLAAQAALQVDVVFGPIRGRVPPQTGWSRDYLEHFFGREGPDATQVIDHAYGCGNSLLVRATALPGPVPFDVAADQTGGEDDALFTTLAARGGTFGWAADAWVDEYAPPHRANLGYALRRAFAYGQTPCQIACSQGNWPGVVRWMVIGAGQLAIYGLAALALSMLRHPLRAQLLDRAARGAGKLLWFRGFEPKFYGSHELERLNQVEA